MQKVLIYQKERCRAIKRNIRKGKNEYMALIDNEKLYENIEKKLELIKAAKEQPVIMKPFIKDFAYRFCWSSNALEGNTLSLDETI